MDESLISSCGLKVQFEFKCPKKWGLLQATQNESVRFCKECQKNVFYCSSPIEVIKHSALGNCIAVDTSSDNNQKFNSILQSIFTRNEPRRLLGKPIRPKKGTKPRQLEGFLDPKDSQ